MNWKSFWIIAGWTNLMKGYNKEKKEKLPAGRKQCSGSKTKGEEKVSWQHLGIMILKDKKTERGREKNKWKKAPKGSQDSLDRLVDTEIFLGGLERQDGFFQKEEGGDERKKKPGEQGWEMKLAPKTLGTIFYPVGK